MPARNRDFCFRERKVGDLGVSPLRKHSFRNARERVAAGGSSSINQSRVSLHSLRGTFSLSPTHDLRDRFFLHRPA